jgi:hypothetical protein
MDIQITPLLRILFESIFIGFAIVIPILSLAKTSNLKTLRFKELFILQAVQAIRIAGIMNILLVLPDAYSVYIEQSTVGVTYPVSFQIFTFYPPLAYLVLSQLFWIKKLYMNKALLVTVCVILLILTSDWFLTVLATGIGGHVVLMPSSWKMHPAATAARLGLNIMIFFFITFMIMTASGKMKKLAETK